MDFKEATDGLFARIDHEDLAKRLGVSVASIRQARLRPEAGAHRAPPENWQPAVIRAAEERMGHYRELIAHLRSDGDKTTASTDGRRRWGPPNTGGKSSGRRGRAGG
jgi:hypothetical protein